MTGESINRNGTGHPPRAMDRNDESAPETGSVGLQRKVGRPSRERDTCAFFADYAGRDENAGTSIITAMDCHGLPIAGLQPACPAEPDRCLVNGEWTLATDEK
jgi:hypothetical protein